MDALVTLRLVLRAFEQDDWQDIQELAADWKAAPGPVFDKWPTDEEGAKGLAGHFGGHADRFYAVYLYSANKVIGLLALDSIEEDGVMDLGHVVLSQYQDNDIDREALKCIVDQIFHDDGVKAIVTRNAHHTPQQAPLRSLGFTSFSGGGDGELRISRKEWEDGRNR
jgi:[ribosomal protein S5]-alanine N-acetyltransferase